MPFSANLAEEGENVMNLYLSVPHWLDGRETGKVAGAFVSMTSGEYVSDSKQGTPTTLKLSIAIKGFKK